jgi:predicted SnoaL-like aldol condensation-catalyzing enzyme
VLAVSAGTFGERSTSYYGLDRLQDGKIAEHWDTLESIPPHPDWKNTNGKFLKIGRSHD